VHHTPLGLPSRLLRMGTRGEALLSVPAPAAGVLRALNAPLHLMLGHSQTQGQRHPGLFRPMTRRGSSSEKRMTPSDMGVGLAAVAKAGGIGTVVLR
jgi:hypothetical protein